MAGLFTTIEEKQKSNTGGLFQQLNINEPSDPAQQVDPIRQTDTRSFAEKAQTSPVANVLDYIFKENPISRVLNFIPATMAQASIPDAPLIRDGKSIPGTSARQSFAEENPIASTGSKTADKILGVAGELGSYVLNPAQPAAGPIQLYNAARNLGASKIGQVAEKATNLLPNKGLALNKAGTKIVESLPSRALREAGKEATVAAAYAPMHSLIQGQTSPQEIATNTALETAAGIAAGSLFPLVGAGVKRILSKYIKEPMKAVEPALALPEGRAAQRLRAAEQRSTLAPNTDPIANPHTFPLPEARPQSLAKIENIAQGRKDLTEINNEIKLLNDRYQGAIQDQYKLLKLQLKDRGGVEKRGALINERKEVVGTKKGFSLNPEWYQQFHTERGRPPSNKELMEIAKEHVDNGYTDFGLEIPSWKAENQFDDSISALSEVKGTLESSIRELDPALTVVETPLKENVLTFPKKAPKLSIEEATGEAVKPTLEEAAGMKQIEALDDLIQTKEPSVKDYELLGFSAFSKQSDYGIKDPTDTRSHIVTKTKRNPLSTPEALNKVYENTADNLQRINQFDKYIEQQTGKKLTPSERSYYLALNSRGSDMTSKHILTEQLVDAQGKAIGKSLKDITKQIPKRTLVNFEDYLIAKHAITRMTRGERVYPKKAEVTPEKLTQKIAQYEKTYPEFKKISAELYDFSNKLGEAWLVDTGIISRNTWQAWREANPFWIPNKREFKDIEKGRFIGTKRGFAGQNNPVKRYSETGSDRPIISPLESMIEYADQFVKTARRNEVMQTVIKQLEKDPESLQGFAEIVRQPEKPSDIFKLLGEENGIDEILARFNDDFDKAMRKTDLNKGNIVSGLINGERVHVKVNDPAFLEALTNLTPKARGKVIETTRKITSVFKVVTTGINPVFSLTRNIFYDIPQAYVYSKTTNNPVRFAWDLLDGIVSTIGNKEMYQSYKAMGGGHSSSVAADRNLLAQSKRAILPQRNKTGLIKKGYNALENLSNIIESAPRIGEFKRITKQGGNSYDSRIKGLFEAQDVTVNFKRYGDLTREADAIFPYMNAAVQGLDKFVRAFKDNPMAVGLKALGAITIPTLALYAINHNNPEYKKLSNYTKDRFFLFPTATGKFVKIPKSRELGVPFGSMVERFLRQWDENDPEAFREFAQHVNTIFSPPGIGSVIEDVTRGKIPNPIKDTIAGPLTEIQANENFIGAPIVPGYLQGLSPRNQYDANTSELAKKIGDVLNVSPKQITHLIRSYGGFIGEIGLPATTQGSSGALGRLKDTATKQVTADPVFSTDASQHFYDLKDKLDTQYKDFRATGVKPKGYNDGARKYLNNIAETMGDITKKLRAVDNSNLSSTEKQKKKRELTELRNKLARTAYQNVLKKSP